MLRTSGACLSDLACVARGRRCTVWSARLGHDARATVGRTAKTAITAHSASAAGLADIMKELAQNCRSCGIVGRARTGSVVGISSYRSVAHQAHPNLDDHYALNHDFTSEGSCRH